MIFHLRTKRESQSGSETLFFCFARLATSKYKYSNRERSNFFAQYSGIEPAYFLCLFSVLKLLYLKAAVLTPALSWIYVDFNYPAAYHFLCVGGRTVTP